MDPRANNTNDFKTSYLRGIGIKEYIETFGYKKCAVQKELVQATRERTKAAVMQISGDEGAFLEIFTKLVGAKKIVEVGTFTGYSTLSFAKGLPEDGKLYACDVSADWTAIGVEYWKKAGVDHKIDLRIAPALETLDKLLETEEGQIDIAFIDADKGNYDNYYERCLLLVRPGGVVIVDNTLWDGRVVNHATTEEAST
eukprot:CAMPEP_0115021352 /NCGR_PEP_ID=MMETSP0216-20121206/30832_1 /TAXON_ID=223996 /ORGANISM="Protocruzia adherens, Strain Boccale" /LENGTH=197 /DNA_ID=CAMNT_0002393685 /DNA_START=877 /DNA_END=1466 /DNA_ORIENTATION=+